jgi:hypothetical protein
MTSTFHSTTTSPGVPGDSLGTGLEGGLKGTKGGLPGELTRIRLICLYLVLGDSPESPQAVPLHSPKNSGFFDILAFISINIIAIKILSVPFKTNCNAASCQLLISTIPQGVPSHSPGSPPSFPQKLGIFPLFCLYLSNHYRY